MSKNIQIKEGNAPKKFIGVKKIRINDYPNGSSLWVPEDETKLGTRTINANGEYVASEEVDSETQENKGWYGYEKVTVNMDSRLGTKTIKENGTYKASEEVDEETHESKGWYGYSQVTVHGVGVASGTNPITGEDSIVSPDPETGKLPESPEDYTDVPSSIAFSVPPSKLDYQDGEEITLSGATVKAYMKANNGTVPWGGDSTHPNGNIPLNELTISPTKAIYNPETDTGEHYTATSDLDTNWEQPIKIVPAGQELLFGPSQFGDWYKFRFSCDALLYWSSSSGNGRSVVYFTDSQREQYIYSKSWRTTWGEQEPATWEKYPISSMTSITIDNKTVYYTRSSGFATDYGNKNKYRTNWTDSYPNPETIWTAQYGEREHIYDGSPMDITVNWSRVGDGKTLSTGFTIYVALPEDLDGGGGGHDF